MMKIKVSHSVPSLEVTSRQNHLLFGRFCKARIFPLPKRFHIKLDEFLLRTESIIAACASETTRAVLFLQRRNHFVLIRSFKQGKRKEVHLYGDIARKADFSKLNVVVLLTVRHVIRSEEVLRVRERTLAG